MANQRFTGGTDPTTGATQQVVDGQATLLETAAATIEAVEGILSELQSLEIEQVDFNADFSTAFTGAPFTKPEAPEVPDVGFTEPEVPEPLESTPVDIPDIGDIPDFDSEAPDITFSPKPSALTETAPGDAPVITDPEMPETPSVTEPDEPLMRAITLPDVPNIDLPTFDESLPVLNFDIPDAEFVYSETPYSSELLAEVTARVRTMLQGGTGLPAFVEQALFDRARSREDMLSGKAIAEAVNEWASRGFSLPGGELNRRLQEARMDNRLKDSTLSRDIMIKVHEVEIENLRFSVQQGIALENIMIGLFTNVKQREFEVAKYTFQSAIDFFNAKISYYNVQLEGFKTLAEVYRTRIQAELAKIEVYKAQLDGQKLVNEINELDVRIYAQKIEAIRNFVEVYKAQLEGVRAQVEVNRSRVDVYRARVEAFGEIVQAKKAEFEAWGEEVRAESAKVGAFEAEARAYAARVQGFVAKTEATLAVPRMEIEVQKLGIDAYQADVQRYAARAAAEGTRIQGITNLFEGHARMYAAELGAEAARANTDNQFFNLIIERGKAQALLEMENVKGQMTQIQETAKTLVSALNTVAQVRSQMIAGALSAIHVAAGITDSAGKTYGESLELEE